MAEIINLKRKRKTAARLAEQQQAAENRARFGRAKSKRNEARAEAERATREVDGKKLD